MDQYSARTGSGPTAPRTARPATPRTTGTTTPRTTGAKTPRTTRPAAARTSPTRQAGPAGPAAPAHWPRPRLTGLGTGALTTVVTVLGGALDSLLFGSPGTLFGLVFVAVSIAGAVCVRPYDLVAAPVAAPIAFAAGIVLTADDGGGGLVGRALGVFTGLALLTGWLYTGTVLAALIVGVRALRLPSRRRRSPRCSATPRGRSPR